MANPTRLAQLIAFRDAMEAARYNGKQAWEYEGESVHFKTDAEYKTALLDLNRQIAAASGAQSGMMTFSTSKGL